MRRKMTNLQLLMTMNYHLMMKSLMANLMSLVQTTSSFFKIIDVKLICALKMTAKKILGKKMRWRMIYLLMMRKVISRRTRKILEMVHQYCLCSFETQVTFFHRRRRI
jgi:hypothetical protein